MNRMHVELTGVELTDAEIEVEATLIDIAGIDRLIWVLQINRILFEAQIKKGKPPEPSGEYL